MDLLITTFDRALRTCIGVVSAGRPYPGAAVPDTKLTEDERRTSVGLMRVNHVGEVCAQALYDSQSIFSKRPETREQFARAGREEQDHLFWTAARLSELSGRPSLLNPVWYGGAFLMGSAAALFGDELSLGFVVETERQVERHLDGHLGKLPESDRRSRSIVSQMRDEEMAHGAAAEALGATEMPRTVKMAMAGVASVMTSVAYWL